MKAVLRVRLALINALGFSASTVMPLWLGGIAHEFGMAPWFAGAAVLAQLGGAAAFNLATPALFGGVRLLPLARMAFAVAAVAYFAAVTSSPFVFLTACLVCGCALGVVLNVTNRLMGSVEHVQKGYAIFVMIEIVVAMALFLGSSALITRHGLLAVFPAVSASAVVGLALLTKLPFDGRMPQRSRLSGTDAGDSAGTRAEMGSRVHSGPEIASRAHSSAIASGLHSRPEIASRVHWRPALTLAAFASFFIGQATLNSFMPTLGQAGGLTSAAANQFIGLGMPAGFVGAILARVIGERVSPIVPVAMVVILLTAVAIPLAITPTVPLFVAGVIALAIGTLFSLPYFFAQLGTFDRAGRYTGFGPAMMLIGLAIGPSSAVMLNARLGLPAVGLFSAALLMLGGIGFAIAARARVPAAAPRDYPFPAGD